MTVYNLSASGKNVTWKEWRKHDGCGISNHEYGAVCDALGRESTWARKGITLGDISTVSKISEREFARYAMERWARKDLVTVAPAVIAEAAQTDVSEGDRILFVPADTKDMQLKYSGRAIEGVAVNVDKTSGGNLRIRIRTDEDAAQGGGKVERIVYSQDGAINIGKRFSMATSEN